MGDFIIDVLYTLVGLGYVLLIWSLMDDVVSAALYTCISRLGSKVVSVSQSDLFCQGYRDGRIILVDNDTERETSDHLLANGERSDHLLANGERSDSDFDSDSDVSNDERGEDDIEMPNQEQSNGDNNDDDNNDNRERSVGDNNIENDTSSDDDDLFNPHVDGYGSSSDEGELHHVTPIQIQDGFRDLVDKNQDLIDRIYNRLESIKTLEVDPDLVGMGNRMIRVLEGTPYGVNLVDSLAQLINNQLVDNNM
jgi:hypothetical protein